MKMVTNIGTIHSQSPQMNVTTTTTGAATAPPSNSLTNMMASSQIPTTNNNNNNEPIKRSASDNRRSNKPIMEKRRRARINNCLNDLKTLILDATKKDPARHSKLEKADILEKTVKHLQDLQRQQATIAKLNDPTMINKYKTGFTECIKEVGRFPDIDQQLKRRLIQHLTDCINGAKLDLSSLPISSSSPPLSQPITISTIPSLTITTAPSPSIISTAPGTMQHSQPMQQQQHQQQQQQLQRLSPSAIALTPIQPVQIHMLQSPGQTLTKLSNIQQGQSHNFQKHQQQSSPQLLQIPQQHLQQQQQQQQHQQQQQQQQQQQILQLASATNGYFVKLSYVPSGPNQQLPVQSNIHQHQLLPIHHQQQQQQPPQAQQQQQQHIMQTQTILPTLVPIPVRTSSTASSTSNFSSTSDRLSIDNSILNSSRCYTPLSPPNSCGEVIDYQMIQTKINNNNDNEHQSVDMNNNNTNNHNINDVVMDDDLSRSDSPQPISLVMKKSCDNKMNDVHFESQQQMDVVPNYNQMYCNYAQEEIGKDGQHWRPW